MENLSYDPRLNLTMPGTQDDHVVVVDVDEKSLAKVGKWPWSRDKLALLIDNLFDHYGVAVVGFDVVFAEKDESSGIKVLEQLGKHTFKNDKMYQQTLPVLRTGLDYDGLFARKLKGRNVVLGYSFSNDSGRAAGHFMPSETAAILPGVIPE
jgi:adenylate cyclase